MADTTTQQPIPSQTETPKDPATAKFDLAITLILNTWPSLTLAVQSSWGGPTSSDKRDWLCGAISDLFTTRPETDAEDIEEVLIQVMNDEFDVVVDDESTGDIAARIMEAKADIAQGNYAGVDKMWADWEAKGAAKAGAVAGAFRKIEINDDTQDTDGEGDDWADDVSDWADDVEMEEAPAPSESTVQKKPDEAMSWRRGAPLGAPQPPPVQVQQKVVPEVDEDGFTTVVSKRRR
ncbi:hypothetical protein FQN55_006822 [Onygenales sp. PD_40]|nr:hypothetical protein FQN55_006822 [Onygenales sp. PD_40]KAK2781065.1 hypothetical protein FQN53_000827 [Emmonsiellopsis sp. PD_33]KAK2805636.1 hypothetical protein FQN51_009139 [Onygenales sp. PD_10]